MLLLALYCNVPPPKLRVPVVPSAPELPTLRVPPLKFVPPVYVFEPESVRVPLPVFVNAKSLVEPFCKVPAKVFANELFTVSVSVHSTEPLSTIGVPTVAFVERPLTVTLLPFN